MLTTLGDGIWLHQTPLRMLGVECGRNMTVVRLGGDGLLVHSPAELTPALRAGLDRLGPVRFVVPASKLHGHVFMEQYREAYPDVELFAAPGLDARRRDLAFDGLLGDEPDRRWADVLDQSSFLGHRLLPEIAFLHRTARTLILGDLLWNVAPSASLSRRLWAGALSPGRRRVGPTPLFRLTLAGRPAARRSLERILGLDFDRVVPGHGEVIESGGHQQLRRAYSWLLDDWPDP